MSTLNANSALSAYLPFANNSINLDTLPNVFMIGENESEYETLVTSCNTLLLTVCEDDMDLAYRKWLGLLSDMEKYAEEKEIDIRGVKIWINVFWDEEGNIKHLVYYPKPNSKNMDFDQLSLFFESFSDAHKLDYTSSKCFSHYGSAAFPTFAELYLDKTK